MMRSTGVRVFSHPLSAVRTAFARSLSQWGGPTEPITHGEVMKALDQWGGALTGIAKTYAEKGDFVGLAKGAIETAYAYSIPGNYLRLLALTFFPPQPDLYFLHSN